ncbi:MAG: adenylate/guanylate cyclase domain-containing protein [Saprospiraceae bacterium]
MNRLISYCFVLLLLAVLISDSSIAQTYEPSEVTTALQNWEYHHEKKDWKKAIVEAEKAFKIANTHSDKIQAALALNRQGQSYLQIPNRKRKNRKIAREKFKSSLFHLSQVEEHDLRISNLKNLVFIAKEEGNNNEAVIYQNQISELNSNEKLSNRIDSLDTQKKQLSLKVESLQDDQLKAELLIALQKSRVDSLSFLTLKDSLELAIQENQIEFQANQLDLQKSQKRFFIALAFCIGLLALGAFLSVYKTKIYNKTLQKKNKVIDSERKKSEELLLNILPKMVAQELKVSGKTTARRYEEATVLFTDFVNFTGIAKNWSSEKLVRELDFYFKAFDEIITKHNLEKIKTIGDAYMCVGGLPKGNTTHPIDAVRAAVEIQHFLKKVKKEKEGKGEVYFEARIGIHTGSLVAGVVGSTKFAFDIWGDTVNIASRFENQSTPEQINISATTKALVEHEFDCTFRGQLPIKNLGEVGMYFVEM